ncbi:hypothetical protein HXT25_05265 [Gardnerella sp. DNF00476]|uniref:hypothetical protein n=1 Tax=Gardnerella sp. DNF00476 TaxID=2749047 RepID=UPI003BB1A45D
MLTRLKNALKTGSAADTKLMELVAQYRNALDQEENALNKFREARDKCQAIKKAEQAVRDAKQKYQDALQELHKQQEKFDEDNTELFCKVSETRHASKDAETRLFDEIRR